MIFERFEEPGLSQYSYGVGCQGTGAIAVIDPMRDIDVYIDYAQRNGVTISHVLETHIHADFASGARELAERTGAQLCLSSFDEGELFEIQFPRTKLDDGDFIDIGNVKLVARHTPGHTPEHMSYLVYDLQRSPDTPMAMLSGDFLFVGSLGRPDLLGKAETDGLARKLHASVRALDGLPDSIEIHPGHGAGSMCGAGMSGRPMSTLGYERIANHHARSRADGRRLRREDPVQSSSPARVLHPHEATQQLGTSSARATFSRTIDHTRRCT